MFRTLVHPWEREQLRFKTPDTGVIVFVFYTNFIFILSDTLLKQDRLIQQYVPRAGRDCYS